MGNLPFVSVCIITYNHDQFIAEAIGSILMQEADFDFELVISDDASSDNTESVVREFIENHPKGHLIKYTRHHKNLGMSLNFQWALNECKGKFIALCEGDDYWIDSNKIKEQVEFLDANDEYVLLADNSIYNHVSKDKKWDFSNKPERDIVLMELLEERQFATASVLFRNSEDLKLNLSKILGDTVLWVFLSKLGKIRFRTKLTSVYRRHESGAVLNTERIEWAKTMEQWNLKIREIAPEVPSTIFEKRNISQFKGASENYLKSGNFSGYLNSLSFIFKIDKKEGIVLVKNHFLTFLKHMLKY
ncbi:glycosyltransferase [Indibacter alkaliphilus LW1]|uniref:Glycosyltransferase n=1 Tax=Indibacter alkaliphilus (strain CCUG 57479 / KCTC 22604 / LW1) TaxID=1189612 RepID=S2DP59_INDAL|nr:glycosyltransferase [Indibacter alkaliphilus]EOZ93756.1 glycosyltransferase [Indibacter alkaliphilus LW1]